LIDTAKVYTNGSSESFLGEFMQGHARGVVLAMNSKAIPGTDTSTRSCGQIAPRVIVLIDLCRAGISHLQRLPASITRATLCQEQTRRRVELVSLLFASNKLAELPAFRHSLATVLIV
jgi:hypothetical protein